MEVLPVTRHKLKEFLSEEIALWRREGWIRSEAHEVLKGRYEVEPIGLSGVLRYTGIAGGSLMALGMTSSLSVLAGGSGGLGVMLALIAAAALGFGLKLTRDPLDRYPQSARALLIVGMLMLGGALVAFGSSAHLRGAQGVVVLGSLWVATMIGLAYYSRNTFLLTMGLLGLYHWIGAWHGMLGHSTYALEIQDPRLMAGVAAILAGLGIAHDRLGYPPSFGVAIRSVSLLYFNTSLLILSIHTFGETADSRLLYVGLAAAGGIAQLIVGARFHDNTFSGFGLTFLGIQMFTRFFERFWDALSKGVFFLAAGLLFLLAGLGLEVLYKNLRSASKEV